MACSDLQCNYLDTYMDTWLLFLFSHASLGLGEECVLCWKKQTKKTGSNYESLQ